MPREALTSKTRLEGELDRLAKTRPVPGARIAYLDPKYKTGPHFGEVLQVFSDSVRVQPEDGLVQRSRHAVMVDRRDVVEWWGKRCSAIEGAGVKWQ